jgi:hypothetical protein
MKKIEINMTMVDDKKLIKEFNYKMQKNKLNVFF